MSDVNVGSIVLRECLNSYIHILQYYLNELSKPNANFEALTKQTRAAAARINALIERCSIESESSEIRKRYPLNLLHEE